LALKSPIKTANAVLILSMMTEEPPVDGNDGYGCFRRLIQQLRGEHFDEAAERLDDLLHHTAWTTGDELIGELGLAIRDFQRTRPRLTTGLRASLKECKKMVRHVCGPFFFW